MLNLETLNKGKLATRAIAHPLRLQVLTYLQNNPNTYVGGLYKYKTSPLYKAEQSVVSQHLAILRKQKLVITKRKGKNIFYSLNPERVSFINQFCESLK